MDIEKIKMAHTISESLLVKATNTNNLNNDKEATIQALNILHNILAEVYEDTLNHNKE